MERLPRGWHRGRAARSNPRRPLRKDTRTRRRLPPPCGSVGAGSVFAGVRDGHADQRAGRAAVAASARGAAAVVVGARPALGDRQGDDLGAGGRPAQPDAGDAVRP